MVVGGDAEAFAEALKEAIERAGGLRPLARRMLQEGTRIHASQLGALRDGFSTGDIRVARSIMVLYPDIGAKLHAAMGVAPATTEDPTSYEWRAIRQAAECAAEKSGVPAVRIVRDAMERYGIEVPNDGDERS